MALFQLVLLGVAVLLFIYLLSALIWPEHF